MTRPSLCLVTLLLLPACSRDLSRITCPQGAELETVQQQDGRSARSCRVQHPDGSVGRVGPSVLLDAQGRLTERNEPVGELGTRVTTFHPQGTRASEGLIEGSGREGEWTFWSEDGRVARKEHYRRGRRVRLYEGRILASFTRDPAADVLGALRSAPNLAIVRVLRIDPGMAMGCCNPFTIHFEVVESLRGRAMKHVDGGGDGLRFEAPDLLEEGALALARIEPGAAPHPFLLLAPPWPGEVEGAVDAVLLVRSVEEARAYAQRLSSRP